MPATDLRVLLYDDQPQSWAAVYHNSSLSCQQRLKWPIHHGTDYRLRPTTNSSKLYSCTNPIVEHQRPRTWFAANVKCAAISDVQYKLTFLDGSRGWYQQFGVDNRGLNTFRLPFFLYCSGKLIEAMAKHSNLCGC